MIDIKVISIRDILPVSRVEVAALQPFSLDVVGQRLSETTEILINDVKAPEYIILSPSHLIVQVPSGLAQSPIKKLTVLAEAPSPTRSSLLNFNVGPTLRPLKGIERTVQLFCKILLQTAGSDRFHPALGGSLLGLAGRTITRDGGSSLAASIIHAVTQTRDQILALQSQNAHIPADERLLSADTIRTGFDPSTTMTAATISLSMVSGKQAVANMSW